jgi:hypothetical protein
MSLEAPSCFFEGPVVFEVSGSLARRHTTFGSTMDGYETSRPRAHG